jgi:hypothetical protein
MITEVHDHPEGTVSSLVVGIVDDFRDLVRQEMALARQHMAEDLRKTRDASLLWGSGLATLFLSAIAFVIAAAYLIHAAALPATAADPASIPMWGCFGIVGIVLAIGGAFLIAYGRRTFESIRVVDQIDKTVKEISGD